MVAVAKAYTTRVGEGPFPTELFDADGDWLRETGGEYGTTTGRPRRTGWYDAVVVRYSARVNGLTDLVVTKLDVLTGKEKIPVCVGYDVGGRRLDEMPADQSDFHHARPIYEYLDGWTEDISGARDWDDLPPAAQRYLLHLEEVSGVRISSVGVGPGTRGDDRATPAAGLIRLVGEIWDLWQVVHVTGAVLRLSHVCFSSSVPVAVGWCGPRRRGRGRGSLSRPWEAGSGYSRATADPEGRAAHDPPRRRPRCHRDRLDRA